MEAERSAVLLDALGTLVCLEPPAPRLQTQLRERLGLEVDLATAGCAVKAEIDYYRANLMRGSDAAGLAELRRECGRVVSEALGRPDVDEAEMEATLLAALEFSAFDDVVPALEAWRSRGVVLVVASNWDISVHEVLEATGLRPLLDGVVCSAELGVAKPDPLVFERALGIAGVGASRALHVGDDLEADVGGARGAGIEPVLIVRDGTPAPDGVRTISALTELSAA